MSRLEQLRSSFNESALLYDQARPGYPESIVDEIVARAAVPPGGKLLEVGCGTGQITVPFARRGFSILALEPGHALAALAAEKCRPYPGVEIMPTTFEVWPVRERAFELVVSAQAFHWIAPDFGVQKAAATLKPGGAIALVWNLDVTGDSAFNQAARPLYQAHLPAPAASEADRPLEEKLIWYERALRASAEFGDLRVIREAWSRTYPGRDYLRLLRTYSNHQTMPEPAKTRFFDALAEVIDRTGGAVTRDHETVVLLARRK